ncbi:MAG: hypothetical protein P8Y37_07910, partial [Anaerolineales bacterium]
MPSADHRDRALWTGRIRGFPGQPCTIRDRIPVPDPGYGAGGVPAANAQGAPAPLELGVIPGASGEDS